MSDIVTTSFNDCPLDSLDASSSTFETFESNRLASRKLRGETVAWCRLKESRTKTTYSYVLLIVQLCCLKPGVSPLSARDGSFAGKKGERSKERVAPALGLKPGERARDPSPRGPRRGCAPRAARDLRAAESADRGTHTVGTHTVGTHCVKRSEDE